MAHAVASAFGALLLAWRVVIAMVVITIVLSETKLATVDRYKGIVYIYDPLNRYMYPNDGTLVRQLDGSEVELHTNAFGGLSILFCERHCVLCLRPWLCAISVHERRRRCCCGCASVAQRGGGHGCRAGQGASCAAVLCMGMP